MTKIELPDELAERLQYAARTQGMELNHFAAAKLENALDEEWEDPEVIALIERGLAEIDAGHTMSLEEFEARMETYKSERRMTSKAENAKSVGIAQPA